MLLTYEEFVITIIYRYNYNHKGGKMLKSIAEEITVVLAANDVIKTDEMEAYNYGLQLLVPKVILYITILIVSLITNTIWVSFAFVVLFMTLRRYAGGFHCKTAETCLFFSFLIYLLVLTWVLK